MVWVVFALVMSVGAGSTVWGDSSSDIENVIVSVDGVEPTAENISNGAYPLHRDLILVTKGELPAPAEDFINWILSKDGQSVVAESGFIQIPARDIVERNESTTSGTVTVVGSTTVMPLMVKLVEVYEKSTDVVVKVMGGGSGKGVEDVKEGLADIGMLSRDLKSGEDSLDIIKIAVDAVVIIVDKASGITNLNMDDIARIYYREVTNWSEIEGGNNLKINPIIRESASGTRNTLDSLILEELDCSHGDLSTEYRYHSSTSSSGAMLFNMGATNGGIGYINMYIAKNL